MLLFYNLQRHVICYSKQLNLPYFRNNSKKTLVLCLEFDSKRVSHAINLIAMAYRESQSLATQLLAIRMVKLAIHDLCV